jgi:hypothetical protein
MAPFEMLYGRRSLPWGLFWNKAREHNIFGPDMLQEVERQVHKVRENLWVAQSWQRSYADHRRRELSFEVGDFVYIKESPMRGLWRFMDEASSQLGSLVHSRSWWREKKNSMQSFQISFPSCPILRRQNEACVCVHRMFKSHVQQQYDKQMPCLILHNKYSLHNDT